MFLNTLETMLAKWAYYFPQVRTYKRIIALLIGLVICEGRRTLSSSIALQGRLSGEWSSDYRIFSRVSWTIDDIFTSVLEEALPFLDADDVLVVSIDDTSLKKCGKCIAQAGWLRDPLSPPFRMNLKFGLRFVHAAVVLPHAGPGVPGRAISVDFKLATAVKKPGKRATEAEVKDYKELKKVHNLSVSGAKTAAALRCRLDSLGKSHIRLLLVTDGGYSNRTFLSGLPPKSDYIGRVGKNIALFRPANVMRKDGKPNKSKIYGDRLPTPEDLRKGTDYEYKETSIYYGGDFRDVRYKEITGVLWRTVTRKRLLRLLIVAPTPYRKAGRKKVYYRDPAYLLTTDLTTPATKLLQAYFDRWQIEPLHRDLKTGMGVGQPQVRATRSVLRIHSAMVAAYSMVQLAALKTYGPARTNDYFPLPPWRKKGPRRPSQHDLITLLRNEMAAREEEVGPERDDESPQRWSLPRRTIYAYP